MELVLGEHSEKLNKLRNEIENISELILSGISKTDFVVNENIRFEVISTITFIFSLTETATGNVLANKIFNFVDSSAGR